ncbi:MAG: hypothetical protein PUG36_01645 [Clostridiales bacterium]|nr:hypothetical protein [Clostridiales bacterium]
MPFILQLIPAGVSALAVAVLEDLGYRKGGVNHHFKARRMQFMTRYLLPQKSWFLLALLLIFLLIIFLIYWKKHAKPSKKHLTYANSASWLNLMILCLDWAFLLAMTLGFLQKKLLGFSYLYLGLWGIFLIRLLVSFVICGLKRRQFA